MPVRRVRAGPGAVDEAAEIIMGGGIVAVPTDTVYGLACDPRSDRAVTALYEAKRRESKPVPLLCADRGVASSLVELNDLARKLAEAYWPGALTLVAPLRRPGTKLSRLLDQGSGLLGVRVPGNEFCVQLASRVGGAITGTSANVSGNASGRTVAEVVESLDGRIQLAVDGGTLRSRESTVVRVTESGVEVLREGSVRIQEGESRV